MSTLRFTVPGSPLSQNRAWKIVTIRGHGTLALTSEGKAYKELVAVHAANACQLMPRWDRTALVFVELDFHFDSRRPDADGPLKLTLDALQGVMVSKLRLRVDGCLENDRQVQGFRVWKHLDPVKPRVEVNVIPVPVEVRAKNMPLPRHP